MVFDWSVAIKVFVVSTAIAIGVGVKYFIPSLPDDNPVEEAAEYIIKEETDLDIDLTPKSPEK